MDFETVKSNADRRIVIVGVGGGGGNAVNRMVEDGIDGVEYVTANTDNQALVSTLAETKIQLGEKLTGGTGAGARPEIGRKAAEESYDKIKEELKGSDMIFVTAGMGGGTGTGAAPIIAQIAKEVEALTIGIVTTPFKFEGAKKKETAEKGLEELKKYLDAIIVIPNDKILEISPKGTTLVDAFKRGNEVLKKGVKGIVDIIKKEGMINIDFADVQTVMKNNGSCQVCHMGFGVAKGENRALDAAKSAITSPLLETSISKAKNVLVNITSTIESAVIEDLDNVGNFIIEAIGECNEFSVSHNIVGYTFDESMEEELSVIVIATGIEEDGMQMTSNQSVSQRIEKTFNSSNTTSNSNSDSKTIDSLFNTGAIQDIEEIKPTKDSNFGLDIPDFLKVNRKK